MILIFSLIPFFLGLLFQEKSEISSLLFVLVLLMFYWSFVVFGIKRREFTLDLSEDLLRIKKKEWKWCQAKCVLNISRKITNIYQVKLVYIEVNVENKNDVSYKRK